MDKFEEVQGFIISDLPISPDARQLMIDHCRAHMIRRPWWFKILRKLIEHNYKVGFITGYTLGKKSKQVTND